MYGYMDGVSRKRMELYECLNDEGKRFVDELAQKIKEKIRKKHLERSIAAGRKASQFDGFGDMSAVELAMAILQKCWSGDLPQILNQDK